MFEENGIYFLQFDLTRNYTSNIKIKYQPAVQEIDYSLSYEFKNTIIIGNISKDSSLFKQVKTLKEAAQNTLQLNELHELFNKKYYIKQDPTNDSVYLLKGNENEYQITGHFPKKLPFKYYNITIKLSKKVACYQYIGHESILAPGHLFNTTKVHLPTIDNTYQFYSSYPNQLKQLFTEENIHRFKLLMNLGTASWTFGQPSKNNFNKPILPRKIKENEHVLDAPFDITEHQQTNFHLEEQTYDTLEFNGVLNPKFERNPEKVKKFMALGMELTEVLAEGINNIR